MDYSKLTNRQLVVLCTREPKNELAWKAFYSRFDNHIRLVIIRECRNKGILNSPSDFATDLEDLVQDVYKNLLKDGCRALKNFRGRSENSIFLYLSVIAKHIIVNNIIKRKAQRRAGKTKSLDEPIKTSDDNFNIILKDIIQDQYNTIENQINFEYLVDNIDEILNTKIKGKNSERDKLIIKSHLYEDLAAEEIASLLPYKLSAKRIYNIISNSKVIIRENLKSFLS